MRSLRLLPPIIGSDEGSVNRRTEGGSRPPPDWKRADRPPPGWKRAHQPPPSWKRTEGGSRPPPDWKRGEGASLT
ncbi:hypothetical protein C8J57DRAFT_1494186 [Mycena rebaudengoi]|nr:hypothetical protein C8J57DRAFT_1494186 [Mycena rebaudengoi]